MLTWQTTPYQSTNGISMPFQPNYFQEEAQWQTGIAPTLALSRTRGYNPQMNIFTGEDITGGITNSSVSQAKPFVPDTPSTYERFRDPTLGGRYQAKPFVPDIPSTDERFRDPILDGRYQARTFVPEGTVAQSTDPVTGVYKNTMTATPVAPQATVTNQVTNQVNSPADVIGSNGIAPVRERGMFEKAGDWVQSKLGIKDSAQDLAEQGLNQAELVSFNKMTGGQFASMPAAQVQGMLNNYKANGVDINTLSPEQLQAGAQAYMNNQLAQQQYAPTGLDWSKFALQGAGQAWGMYNNYQQLKMAQDSYDEMKALTRANYRNQARSLNAQYRDQMSGRGYVGMTSNTKRQLGKQYDNRKVSETY